MLAALILAATAATASPQSPVTSNPLLRAAAPKPNIHATAGPLLREAAPGGHQQPGSLRGFSGAAPATSAAPAIMNDNGGRWGWAGLFGALGLIGLWRRYSGM